MKTVNKIVLADCRDLRDYVDDDSVSLIFTSPPYNVEKPYEKKMSEDEYLAFLRDAWKESMRILKIGGRIGVNVADTGRRPYTPLHALIMLDLRNMGFFLRGEITWDKMNSSNKGTSWGSFKSPSCPYIRDVAEYIVFAEKNNGETKGDEIMERFAKDVISEKVIFASKTNERLVGSIEPDITVDEFLEYSKNVWHINTDSATRVGHPAPFPLELAARAIKFYTYPGDLVVDIFNGSGTTCLAAKMLGRRYMGFDVKKEYVELATRRVDNYKEMEEL